MVRWRRRETSKPPPSRLLDEHIAGSVPSSRRLELAREDPSLTRSRFRYRSLTAAGKPYPGCQDCSARHASCPHHTSFVRFGLYQEHWHGLSIDIPIPDRAVDWTSPSQASLDVRTYFLSYTSRVTALPLFHLFRVVPIATLPILFDQSLLYGLLLISLFFALYTGSWLSSTSSQAAQIPKRGCSILLHSSTHHTHFRRHRTYQSSNTIPTSSPRGIVVQFRFAESTAETLRIPYLPAEQYNTLSCTSSDLITSGMLRDFPFSHSSRSPVWWVAPGTSSS